jgi:MSHA pilin protein MshA
LFSEDKKMQHQRGFTLIELIIVIVILGILAVTAAPKFIDIQGDAQSATLKGVKAALQGGVQLVYAKSAIGGQHKNAYVKTVERVEPTLPVPKNEDGTGGSDGVEGVEAVEGTEDDTQAVVNGLLVSTDFGYPSAESFAALRSDTLSGTDVASFVDLSSADWDFTADFPGVGSFAITPNGKKAVAIDLGDDDDDTRCQVIYNDASNANSSPTINLYTGGC